MSENNSQNTRPRRSLITALKLLGVLVATVYLVLSFAAPVKKLKTASQSILTEVVAVFPDSSLNSLVREKIFIESRIEMAGFDSAGISLDLSSATARLELKGVTLQSFDIRKIKYGHFFRTLDIPEYSYLFRGSFPSNNHYANFKKEPVRVVDAPRDTTALPPDVIPVDTINPRPVHASLQLENGIRIILIDNDAPFVNRVAWDIGERIVVTAYNLKHIILFRIPDYRPAIKIYLSRDDIRTLYRALPENGPVVIRI